MSSIVVAMPAYNEAEGIPEFLHEISVAFSGLDLQFVVVDDCSADGTANVVKDLGLPGMHALRNEVNSGHGPSTLRALQEALDLGGDIIVAVDGDGQFRALEMRRLVDIVLHTDLEVVEGIRTHRDDPWFRRITSATTRQLVRSRSGDAVLDANTPLRVYRREALARLLRAMPTTDMMVPNLAMSVFTRRWGMRVAAIPVASLPRRGSTEQSVTWKQRRAWMPSKHYVEFCAKAARQWVALDITEPSQ